MLFVFHDRDEVCPGEFLFGYGFFVVESRKTCFVLRRKEFGSSWTAVFGLVADEEDAHNG